MTTLEDASRPQVRYARAGDQELQPDESHRAENAVSRALDLARQIEELLEETRSVHGTAVMVDTTVHSTRMARAMAASLVDELENLARPARKAGVA